MKITGYLNVEHGVFLNQLKHLESLLERKAPKDVLAAVVETIAGAVAIHREVEERFLYPAIERAVMPSSSPIDQMEFEHQEIERALEQIRTGQFDAGVVRTFAGVLQAHILKEIQMLFPMAEERIAVEELVELKKQAVQYVHDRAGVKVSKG